MTQQYGLPDGQGGIESYYTIGQRQNIINHPTLGTIVNPTEEQVLSSGRLPINIPTVDAYQHLGDIIIEPTQITYAVVRNDLVIVKEYQKSLILLAYEDTGQTVPATVDGVDYYATIDSALRLDGARRSTIEAIDVGMAAPDSTVIFTDTDRVSHVLTLTEALVVCLTVAAKAQADFTNKQSKMVAITNAETVEEVKTIVW